MVSFYVCLGYQEEATLPRAQLSIAVYKQAVVRLAAVCSELPHCTEARRTALRLTALC
jgi:hypothetical protein